MSATLKFYGGPLDMQQRTVRTVGGKPPAVYLHPLPRLITWRKQISPDITACLEVAEYSLARRVTGELAYRFERVTS